MILIFTTKINYMFTDLVKIAIVIILSILLGSINKGHYPVYPSYMDVMMLEKASAKLKSSRFLSQNRGINTNYVCLPKFKVL